MNVAGTRAKADRLEGRSLADSCLALAICLLLLTADPAPLVAQWLAPVQVCNIPNRWDTESSFDFDAAGKVHIVWQEWDDYGFGAVFYSNNVGGVWAAPQTLGSPVGRSAGGPRLLITPDQVVHVLYALNCCDNGIFYTYKPVSTGTWSASSRLDTSPEGRYLTGAAKDASGGISMIWLKFADSDSSTGVWHRYKPLGGAWGASEPVETTGSTSNFPQDSWVGTHGNDIYATYYLTGDKGLRFRKRGANGVWSNPSVISSPGGGGRLAWSSTGEMAAVWHQDLDGNASGQWFEVFAKFSTNDGAAWGPVLNVSSKTALDRNPEVCYDAKNDLHVVWQGFDCDGCQPDVFYRARISGSWQPGANLTNSAYRTGISSNALRPLGNTLYLAYTDTGSNLFEDVFMKVNPQAGGGPTGTISGFVRDQYGAGVANATVMTIEGYTTSTGAGGAYSLMLPPATYGVTAGKINYLSQSAAGVIVTANATVAQNFVLTGQAPAAISSLQAVEGSTQTLLAWTNSASANASSVVVRYSTTTYPNSPSEGLAVVSRATTPGASGSYTQTGLTNGVNCYYAAFACFADASLYCAAPVFVAAIPHVRPDFDRDGDVDSADWGTMQNCLTGPYVAQAETWCAPTMLDGDNDVDGDDVAVFVNCYRGTGAYAPADCGG